jgi:WD40 repeat protein
MVHRYVGHYGDCEVVLFSPDGQTLVSGSTDCTIKFWQLSKLALPSDIARQSSDGVLTLPAADATLHGEPIRYEDDKDCIGYWTNQSDWASWKADISKPDKFDVEITFACGPGCGGSQFKVAIAGESLSGVVKETGEWTKFTHVTLGTVTIAKGGPLEIELKCNAKPGPAVMNLRSLVFRPRK